MACLKQKGGPNQAQLCTDKWIGIHKRRFAGCLFLDSDKYQGTNLIQMPFFRNAT